MSTPRVVVIGDIAGHRAALVRCLSEHAGMDPHTFRLPDNVTVVQVGDLIHRGPASAAVIGLVAAMRRRQPEQWVQLVGNHEALYLPGTPGFHWPEVIEDEAEQTLNQWWSEGWMRVAAAIETADGEPLLVTHAGLTQVVWDRLGAPADAAATATALNALPGTDPDLLWGTGLMLGAQNPRWTAGPVWAESSWEVYGSWLVHAARGLPVPFGQVHGHSTPFDYWAGRWRAVHPMMTGRFSADTGARLVRGTIGDQTFHAIDPSHGKRPAGSWAPLVLDGARLLA